MTEREGRGAGQLARRFSLAAILLGSVAVWLLGAWAAQARTGSGDPFFPGVGNTGYDVGHYGVHLAYAPGSGELRGAVTVNTVATRSLPRFTLDLDGLRVTGVTVDRRPARFSRGADKLVVVPAEALQAGKRFLTAVHYRGVPHRVIDPDGSAEGWIHTADGAVGLGEPVGTAAWMPCNDTPADKASFLFQLTVPAHLKAISNGRLHSVRRHGGRKTFEWGEPHPMAPYLAVVDIGRGRLVRGEIAGVPAWTFVDPELTRSSRRALRALPSILRFESRIFGPYPFDALGSIVDPVPIEYALETQTRPIYAFSPGKAIVAHELAHQWFGDSVGLTRWPEIWLNEGFATWAEWFYAERHGGAGVAKTFDRLYRTPASQTEFWDPPSGHPGTPEHLFGPSVYERGGMALQALREKIGTQPFLGILRDWATAHRYGNATIPQFIALTEEVSGRQLGPFFNDWLYQSGKPRGYAPRSREDRGGPGGASPLLLRRALPDPPLLTAR